MAVAIKVAAGAEVATTVVVATTGTTDLLRATAGPITAVVEEEAITRLRRAGSRLLPARLGSELAHRLRPLPEIMAAAVDGDNNSRSHTSVATMGRRLQASTTVVVVVVVTRVVVVDRVTRCPLPPDAMITDTMADVEVMVEAEMVGAVATMAAVVVVDIAAEALLSRPSGAQRPSRLYEAY